MTVGSEPAAPHDTTAPARSSRRARAARGPVVSEVSTPLQRQGRPATTHATRPELVARLGELVRTGHGALVVGDAGVGKTHLVNLVVGELVAEGAFVLTLTATAARRAMPFGALEPLLGDEALLGVGSSRVARAVVETLRDRAALDEGVAGDGEPLLVLRVENAHLLDAASSQVVDWLARHEPVVVLVSARPSAASWSPWIETWRDGVLERVDVEPLDFPQTESFLVAELGGPVTAEAVHRLWRLTNGNVFYLAELVRDLRHAGDLSRADGVWVWEGEASTSRRLLDVVAHDVANVGDDVRRLLEEIALGGPQPLHKVLDRHPRSAVQELLALGLVCSTEEPVEGGANEIVLRITHPLYGDAVASLTSASRQREVLEGAVVGYVARVGSPDDLLRWVNRAVTHGVEVPDRILRDGYDASMESLNRQTAVAFASEMIRVHASRGGFADTAEGRVRADLVRVELLLCRAEAWRHFGSRELAQHDFREAREILATLPHDADDVIALTVRTDVLEAQNAHYRGDDLDSALEVLDAGLARVTAIDSEAARVATTRLVRARLSHLGWAGRVPEALDGLLAEIADPEEEEAVVPLVGGAIVALAMIGRFNECDELFRRYMPAAVRGVKTYRWGPSDLIFTQYAARMWRGASGGGEMQAMFEDAVPGAVDWTGLHMHRGFDAIAQGAWSTARSELKSANVRVRRVDLGSLTRLTLAAEALAAAAVGDAVGARALVAQCRETPVRGGGCVEAQVELVLVETMMWLREPMALTVALELAARARSQGLWRVELEALHRAVVVDRGARSAEHDAVLRRVETLAERVEGTRAGFLRDHVRALVAEDADLARIAERELNRAGLWLPPAAPIASLTAREQEIALLAAGGMTSRAIAQRLTLSVRTIDSHLARVFAKLGVHSREDLAGVLR